MISRETQILTRRTVAAYLCIAFALVLLVLLGLWGAYRDLRMARLTVLLPEIERLRSSVLRSVGHIENILQQQDDPDDLLTLRDDPWLQNQWKNFADDQRRLYAAIVDARGFVVRHSDERLQGRPLERSWYDRVLADAGADVVETRSESLTGGQPAFDVRVPIMVDGREVGEYHAGLDASWFQERVEARESEILQRWGIIMAGILLVVVLAAVALYYLARWKLELGQTVDIMALQRITELGQLAAGLAHEIRNPLHAIRLNMHALGRMQEEGREMDRTELMAILRESNQEIDRVDRLMQELVGFANPEEAREEYVNVGSEVQATLNFIQQELARKGIEVRTQFPDQPAIICIDPSRLRQIMLNLLMNARDAVGEGGWIEVGVRRHGGRVDITVADNGTGIKEADRSRIFEPFYSTKDAGTGLGLALVKRFVGDADGTVVCDLNGARGAVFRISFPACTVLERK